MVEVPRGLKQRWKPFGWSEHYTLPNHEYKLGNLAQAIKMAEISLLWPHDTLQKQIGCFNHRSEWVYPSCGQLEDSGYDFGSTD